ncbi:MAG: hypothetical protein ABR90_03010 [Cryomorphaceae bacterium BACL29 MAG-121220-bin8]|jgi:hypothetical protein|nr:MAG: hypothetical protein ABR90_03010 [Cryomorphaceae bacterium BACL29 MAG-121220-bin8]|tara:strand:- start:33624 stop:34163 length:540 start_codon:yes stop_codon:yes gene_type:complete
MKKILLYSVSIILILILGGYLYITLTPPASPLDTSSFVENEKEITITYSQPYKKGRLIFGEESADALVPYNQYWRTGANKHTIIKTNSDLNFSDNILQPGEYSLYTTPGLSSWNITINSDNGFFGIVQPDAADDLFTFNVPVSTLDESVEQLKIDFVTDSIGSSIRLRWDLTQILIPFK